MIFCRLQILRAVFLAMIILPVAPMSGADSTNTIQFNRDIRPILSENCFLCHGPDKNRRKAKMRLDVREVALEREAFVPGKPDKSELVRRIHETNPDDLMPPTNTHKTLTPAQKELLTRWIAQGAEYQPHWSFITPKRPAIPAIRNLQSAIRNPIDAFVLATLEARNIQPSPEADQRTLLRRLSLDLIGLPPTPEEMAAFLKDKSPRAYEKQVDRLLASPHYGERMAAPWLDVVRYADTVGYHGDQNQNIFPYRDYVINAFNQNKPFDQFTIEQLAGDLLPDPTTEQRVASGFNRLNMMTREGGAQDKEYLAKYQADRVRTVSAAWLGSTMGCAECHDHKFDPFATKDFYQMEAYFADIKQWGIYTTYEYTPNPDLPDWDNDHPFPPEIEVTSPYLQKRMQKLQGQLAATQADAWKKLRADKKSRADFAAWVAASRTFLKIAPDGWLTPPPDVKLKLKDRKLSAETNFTVQAGATISFSRQPRDSTAIHIPLTNQWLAAIRLQVLPFNTNKVGMKDGNQKINLTFSASLETDDKSSKLSFSHADADFKATTYAASLPIIGVKDGWNLATNQTLQTAVWLLDQPVKVVSNASLIIKLGSADVASARVSVSPFAADNPLQAGGSETLRNALSRSGSKQKPAVGALLLSTLADTNFLAQTHALQSDLRECRGGRMPTQIVEAREPLVTRVLPRGNWQDETGEVVQPAPPHFLPQLPDTNGRRQTRLDLARWLVSPENPLTSRAVMNRLWKQFFGTGISAVVDDLGAQGEWPTHPELLDWLAVEFRESGWDVKHMIKLIVMSATYRQTSGPRPDLKDIDPNNRLLASQSPRRLEAESVRDNALFIAGLLDEDIGGPSAHPYQPPGYYAALQFPDRDYFADKDEREYRRGVYTWWQRAFFHPMLANFDAPAREECTAARNISNTPQQALTLLNDPTFVEASRAFAEIILAAKARSDQERMELAFQRALSRSTKPEETTSLEKFLAEQRSYYGAHPEDARK